MLLDKIHTKIHDSDATRSDNVEKTNDSSLPLVEAEDRTSQVIANPVNTSQPGQEVSDKTGKEGHRQTCPVVSPLRQLMELTRRSVSGMDPEAAIELVKIINFLSSSNDPEWLSYLFAVIKDEFRHNY